MPNTRAVQIAQIPFLATNAQTGVQYIGVTGIGMTMALNRVTVDTPFNINVTINTTGNQLTMGQGSLVTWIPINPNSSSIWTEIGT